jgi:hypothetical protein
VIAEHRLIRAFEHEMTVFVLSLPLRKKREELVRVREQLRTPGVHPGIARELRKQFAFERHRSA